MMKSTELRSSELTASPKRKISKKKRINVKKKSKHRRGRKKKLKLEGNVEKTGKSRKKMIWTLHIFSSYNQKSLGKGRFRLFSSKEFRATEDEIRSENIRNSNSSNGCKINWYFY